MRRTAGSVTTISQSLRSRGVVVTARRIEGWAAAGLGPSPHLSFEGQLDHYVALAWFSGKGIAADTTALRLAANSFDCARLRLAVLRYFNLTEPISIPRLHLDSSENADEAFALVEDTAREVATQFVSLAPTALVKIFRALQRNAAEFAELADRANGQETGETVFHSFLVSSACYFFGGEFYNAKALAATVNVDPNQVDESDLDFANSIARMEPEEIDQAYFTLPTDRIVAMATLLRGAAPRALAHLELDTLTDSEVDQVCTVVAPMLVYRVRLIREHICEQGLEVLAPVLAIMDDHHALSA
jgi:hypothetical protein